MAEGMAHLIDQEVVDFWDVVSSLHHRPAIVMA
jgi:hypothetical protein